MQLLVLTDGGLSGSLPQPVCLRRRGRLQARRTVSRTLHSWSDARPARHSLGVCRTAYGEVLVTPGKLGPAEEELLRALDVLRATLALVEMDGLRAMHRQVSKWLSGLFDGWQSGACSTARRPRAPRVRWRAAGDLSGGAAPAGCGSRGSVDLLGEVSHVFVPEARWEWVDRVLAATCCARGRGRSHPSGNRPATGAPSRGMPRWLSVPWEPRTGYGPDAS